MPYFGESAMTSESSTITSKGQLVIPAKLRRKHGLRKGTRIAFVEDGTRLILQPITREFLRSLRGSLKGEPSLLEILLEERKKEREL
jgi:AbrB family looped-hinge helix DNA binding protein